MDDNAIIELFYERSEQAIKEVSAKYGSSIKRIAYKIVGNKQDMEECENDTYLAAWTRIPPEFPNPLAAYLFRITRNIAIKRYHANTTLKRNNTYDLALDELDELIQGSTYDPVAEFQAKELSKTIEAFLYTLNKEDRFMFMRRYWHFDSVTEIASQMHWKSHRVTVRLSRIRDCLQKYLQKEGMMS